MYQLNLYKKSPFQFNDTPFILCPPNNLTGTFKDYVKSEIAKLQRVAMSGTFPSVYPTKEINGNETELYITFPLETYLKALPTETTAAGVIKYMLEELRTANLLQVDYMPASWSVNANGIAVSPYVMHEIAFTYFFDVEGVEVVPPYVEEILEQSTDPHPVGGNGTVKGYSRVLTFRLEVRRNKMLEAYTNGSFEIANAPRLCGGGITEATREFINRKIPFARFSAYKMIQPAEGSGEGYKSGFFERMSTDYKDRFYCLVIGTTKFTEADSVGEQTAVFVLATYDSANKAMAEYRSSTNIDTVLAKLGAAKERKRTTTSASNTFSFTPYAVYVVPRGCFLGDPTTAQRKAGDLWIKDEIITESGAAVPVVELKQSIYTTLTIGRPVASFETLTVGTSRTRVKMKNLLVTEPTDDTATKGKTTDELTYNAELNNVTVKTQITDGSRNGVKITLIVGNAEYDITNDFSGALSSTNISNAQLQAEATAKATDFIQQGAGVVLGGAAIIGGAVSGNIPAVVAGVSSFAGSVSGIIQNTQKEAPRQTAAQTGTPDGLANIQYFDGVYFETFAAWNETEIKRIGAYNVAVEKIGALSFIDDDYSPAYSDRAKLTTAGAWVSSATVPKDVETQLETKLNGGAVLCYGVDPLKAETGV